MSKSKRKSSAQIDLFNLPEDRKPSPGSLNCEYEIRAQMIQAIKSQRLSRAQIADEMSELIGRTITKEMLDSWTAESKKLHRPPAEILPAFCFVTKSDGPIRAQVVVIGREIADPRNEILAEYGAACLDQEEATYTKQEIRRKIRR